ncbi:MAG TPA: twin-arginine translocase TatA/TatE family subunit, partial [Chloroflexota bacterium]
MFNVGPLELMVLLVLALIVFGPAKLPELMASAGNAIREFQRASRELTEVFQETQAEFSSALDLETAATTVTEPAAEPGANGHATTEVASAVPVAPDLPATTAPAEYETAAAMVDPVEPYPEPHREAEPPPAAPATAAPAEYATAAALLDDAPPPFEIKLGPSEAAPEPVTVAKVRRPRRPRAADGVSAATEPVPAGEPGAGAPPTSSTAGIGPDAAPLPESVVAIAPPPVNGATPARRRTPRPRAKAVPGPVGPGSPAPAA